MKFQSYLTQRLDADGFSTEDALGAFLPLVRETLEAHAAELVAPLVGIEDLNVEGNRIWFEEAKRLPFRRNPSELKQIQSLNPSSVEIVNEIRRSSSIDEGEESTTYLSIGVPGEKITRPVFLPGYVAWEHECEHHDPLTDIFSLGMILASLACGLDFSEPNDLERFAHSRDNLFQIQPALHPVLARAIVRMTEVDRHRRAQDLPAILSTLENYRDQGVDFEIDLARIEGLKEKDSRTKQAVVLTRLRERLFDLTRRNRLLHFKATMQSVNLTQASVPLSFDVKNVRPDQILVWNDATQREFISGKPVSLNKYLNFSEAIYLPSLLDRTIAEARRDQAEYGFAQLRLVVCFLHWANLKEKPIEQYDSPFILLPVQLSKKKGIRDTFQLEVLESDAEINPVVRHQFKQLYNIELPDRIDLKKTSLDEFFSLLAQRIESSDVSVTLKKVDRPRISLIHERAKRRLDQYRRRARLAGRGVRKFQDLDYSYDPANYHPLGVKLYNDRVRAPETHLRSIIEEKPRPRTFAIEPHAPAEVVKEKSFYSLHEGGEDNPYTWTFDLCSVTLANFKYRKMSLVRDYDSLAEEQPASIPFESIFSLAPRTTQRTLPPTPALEDRFDVVPCDPTQATAIEEARTGKSYIIQGPPGTGKSQTITNLIADYVARGKRVLFVCEKRAAIDVVFARLRHCGLKSLCCLIHDSQTDKKEFVMDLKETYERFLQEEHSRTRLIRRDTVLRRMDSDLSALQKYDDAITSHREDAGMSLRELLDHGIALQNQRTDHTSVTKGLLPIYSLWSGSRVAIDRYTKALTRVQSDAIASRHPLFLVSPKMARQEHPIDIVTSAIEKARPHWESLVQQLGKSGVPASQWETLNLARELVDYARRIHPASSLGLVSLLDEQSEVAQRWAGRTHEFNQKLKEVSDAANKTKAWRKRLPEEEVETAIEQAQSFEGKWLAWLSPQWWRLRGILNQAYDFSSHVVRPSWRQVLEGLREEYGLQRQAQEFAASISQDFGAPANIESFLNDLNQLKADLKTLPASLTRVHQAILKSPKAQQIIDRVFAAEASLVGLEHELSRFAEDADMLPLSQLGDALAGADDSLEDLPDFLEALEELLELPREIRRALRTAPLSPAQLEAASIAHTVELCYRRADSLEQFDGGKRAKHALELQRQYDRWLGSNAREILRSVEERFSENVRLCEQPAAKLSAVEKERKKTYSRGRRELEHEFGKSMRYKPIRELVSGDSGEVVKDLKPVWLMSPLSVSDTLPLDTDHFDIVIFDEASQLTLEESIPSIFRATQCIVVGDEMQLPPTDFFSTKRSEDDDEELLIEEEGELVQYDLESDSFLNHAAKNLPSTMLGWHYRSRSESLISFSNWKFYDGRLLTVPEEQISDKLRPSIEVARDSAKSQGSQALLERAVSYHYLPHATYENRRNSSEADYIAHMVRELIRDPGGKTIGVVAFSEAQQGEIQDALLRLAGEDKVFANRLELEYERDDDGQFVGLLVKNLENIQGDERDVIILSVCYGKDRHGKMRMNFGPINKSGGEKRLNVAFSRAKEHMALVSSIKHTEITNDYNDGANCLKQYLRYAEAASISDSATVHSVLRGLSRWMDSSESKRQQNTLAEAISAKLKEKGFIVDADVGHSHFRCDLAIHRPGDEAYRLGVLLDTLEHYEQSDLLERDMMRPRLLRNFGWRITQVFAKDWYADPASELDRLLQILAGAEDPWLASHEKELGESVDITDEEQPTTAVEVDDASEHSELELARLEKTPVAEDTSISKEQSYLELKDDHSQKFWEITLSGNSYTVRFGRIGTSGQSRTKTFADNTTAAQDYQRLLREKTAKGYIHPDVQKD
ncbi:DNA helicase [Blastopirellula marina]|uniref:DNA helicase n=1 Tax=Blastopirellula marina TaxID=124 RepID=A0A2S8G324_9BACT|nr:MULTISPECIES: AAA domain-containing protein [Pirellulaceae]PQO38849.1 DNA helicase [Blastopirellula marina]RCS55157.1 WGR domain-containing protein [Bremerella cremea]